jgi:hypothetical protein
MLSEFSPPIDSICTFTLIDLQDKDNRQLLEILVKPHHTLVCLEKPKSFVIRDGQIHRLSYEEVLQLIKATESAPLLPTLPPDQLQEKKEPKSTLNAVEQAMDNLR